MVVVFNRQWVMEDRIKTLFTHFDDIHIIKPTVKSYPTSTRIKKTEINDALRNTQFENTKFDYSGIYIYIYII